MDRGKTTVKVSNLKGQAERKINPTGDSKPRQTIANESKRKQTEANESKHSKRQQTTAGAGKRIARRPTYTEGSYKAPMRENREEHYL